MARDVFVDRRVRIGPSSIHGQGVFAQKVLLPGEVLDEGPGEDYEATEADLERGDVILVDGRLIGFTAPSWTLCLNHARPANLRYERRGRFTYPVVQRLIRKGEELTLDYRECVHPKDPVYREMRAILEDKDGS